MNSNDRAIMVLDSDDEAENNMTSVISDVNQPRCVSSQTFLSVKPLSQLSSPQIQEDCSTTCPICLEEWTNLGEHRMCSLKCGHLFGFSCISRWITELQNDTCPTCKTTAVEGDIRHIYARKLVAIDNSDMQETKEKLSAAAKERNYLQIELTKAESKQSLITNEVDDLKKQVTFLNWALGKKNKYTTTGLKMYKEKSVELENVKECRVLSYYKNDNLIVASTMSLNSQYPGFGVQKFDISILEPTTYIPLHLNAIRDLQFHAEKPWLLSVSLDKTIKIFDTNSNSILGVLERENLPLWSCCWDTNDLNSFFVGEQENVVKYDCRQMRQPTNTYQVPGDHSPVVSISSITAGSKGPLPEGGIISCKLNSLWVFSEMISGEYTRYFLPINPPFICATYDNSKPQMLVSTKPTLTVPHTRHHISSLVFEKLGNLTVNVSHCLEGGATSKLLSRSCLLSHQGCSYAAAYQESDNIVCLWSTETGQRASIVPVDNAILDLCSVNLPDFTYLFSLTDSTIDVFKLE